MILLIFYRPWSRSYPHLIVRAVEILLRICSHHGPGQTPHIRTFHNPPSNQAVKSLWARHCTDHPVLLPSGPCHCLLSIKPNQKPTGRGASLPGLRWGSDGRTSLCVGQASVLGCISPGLGGRPGPSQAPQRPKQALRLRTIPRQPVYRSCSGFCRTRTAHFHLKKVMFPF